MTSPVRNTGDVVKDSTTLDSTTDIVPHPLTTILDAGRTVTPNGDGHTSADPADMLSAFLVSPVTQEEAGAASGSEHARSVAAYRAMLDSGDPARVQSAKNADARGDGAAREALDAYNAATQEAQETPAQYWRQRLFTVGEFIQRPRKQWLYDQLIGAQDNALLYGGSGEGKTHVGLDFAFSAATGRTFADAFTCAAGRPLSVCYATGEGLGGLADRLRAVSSYYGTQDVPFYILSDVPQLYEGAFNAVVGGFVRAWQELAEAGAVPEKLDVLVIDTLHNATQGADENSSKDAGIEIQQIRKLRDALGCAVVLVHHAGKNGMSERGSSALRASMDTVLRSTKTGRTFTLTCEKLKDGEAWPSKSFALETVAETDSVRVAWRGDAQTQHGAKVTLEQRVTAFLREHAGTQYTAHEVGQGIDEENRTAVMDTLRKLRAADSVRAEKVKRVTADGKTRAVTVHWIDADSIVKLDQDA